MSTAPDDISAIDLRRSLPPGGDMGEWRAPDGQRIRTWYHPGQGAKGAILFLGGRADFIEKYTESYWRWTRDGYALATFDWRGQGLSDREGGGCEGLFERRLADLGALIDWAGDALGQPLVLAGHSMGGHMALRYLALHPQSVQVRSAVLMAPMLGIAVAGLPGAFVDMLARLQVRLGRAERFPPGQGPYGGLQRSGIRQARLTSDSERFADEHWWIESDPGRACDGATYGWLAEAARSNRRLAAAGALERIECPALFLLGERESLVDAAAARAAAARMPNAACRTIAGGAHELLRESDAIQAQVHGAITDFLAR